MQDCLRALKKQRTTVTVAHRLSTVREADIIIALENGAIAAAASADESEGSGADAGESIVDKAAGSAG